MEEQGGHAVHVPQQSFAPVIIGTGIFFINLAFVVGLPVAIFGALVLLFGIATWIREDIRHYREGSDEDGGHH